MRVIPTLLSIVHPFIISTRLRRREQGQLPSLEKWRLRALFKGTTVASFCPPKNLNRQPSDYIIFWALTHKGSCLCTYLYRSVLQSGLESVPGTDTLAQAVIHCSQCKTEQLSSKSNNKVVWGFHKGGVKEQHTDAVYNSVYTTLNLTIQVTVPYCVSFPLHNCPFASALKCHFRLSVEAGPPCCFLEMQQRWDSPRLPVDRDAIQAGVEPSSRSHPCGWFRSLREWMLQGSHMHPMTCHILIGLERFLLQCSDPMLVSLVWVVYVWVRQE